jgi:hypothetical protein
MRSDDTLAGLPPLPSPPISQTDIEAYLSECLSLNPRIDSQGHTISRVHDAIALLERHYPNLFPHSRTIGEDFGFRQTLAQFSTPTGFDGEDGG